MMVPVRPLRRICALPIAAAASLAQAQAPLAQMPAVPRADLCVTEGALDALRDPSLGVAVPKMRAYVNQPSADAAQLSFTYLGPTEVDAPLGSGAARRQFGVKLRAKDACNLLYVMWRIEPESKLVVSVKANPGQRSSSDCVNHGYRNLRFALSAPIPRLQPAQAHKLLALIRNQELRAYVDGALVWRGRLDAAAAALTGPAGVRTDNVRLQFVLSTDTPATALAQVQCQAGAAQSD
jgi:hypothetical protein